MTISDALCLNLSITLQEGNKQVETCAEKTIRVERTSICIPVRRKGKEVRMWTGFVRQKTGQWAGKKKIEKSFGVRGI